METSPTPTKEAKTRKKLWWHSLPRRTQRTSTQMRLWHGHFTVSDRRRNYEMQKTLVHETSRLPMTFAFWWLRKSLFCSLLYLQHLFVVPQHYGRPLPPCLSLQSNRVTSKHADILTNQVLITQFCAPLDLLILFCPQKHTQNLGKQLTFPPRKHHKQTVMKQMSKH